MIKLKFKYGNSQTDLRFPCTEKEMNAALERIHAEDIMPLELYVSEVIFPEELGCLQDRFVDLDEVNYLGKRMDSFFGDEEYQFYEAMKLEGFDTLPDLINLSFNLNRYPLIQDISDMGKIGREYLLTVKGCLPADDADDPKYAEFGRELIRSGKGVFTEHGLLFVDEDTPFVKDYDGQNFPAYVYDFVEDVEARVLHHKIEGSGYPYRECVTRKGVDLLAYDRLFFHAADDDYRAAIDIALDRLMYPLELETQAREVYEQYLEKNVKIVLERLIEDGRCEEVITLCDLCLISRDAIEPALQLAAREKQSAITAQLMEYQRMHFAAVQQTQAMTLDDW